MVETPPCDNAGSGAQATVRVFDQKNPTGIQLTHGVHHPGGNDLPSVRPASYPTEPADSCTPPISAEIYKGAPLVSIQRPRTRLRLGVSCLIPNTQRCPRPLNPRPFSRVGEKGAEVKIDCDQAGTDPATSGSSPFT